ncbi:MAG: T9SS type A sorting domain-containing protein, partial [bacterium]
EYLYGSSGSTIFQMTLEGEVIGRLSGPYDPNVALTVDDEGYFWVGNDRSPLRKIDRRGEVLATIPHNLPVRALAWFPDSQDGYSLLLLVQPPQGIHLYQMNPTTGFYRFLADLTQEEGEVPSYGLHLTYEWDGVHWSLIGIVGIDRIKKLVVWNYAPLTNWIDFAPTEGTIEPGDRATLNVGLDAHNLVGGLSYQQTIQILNNGREPVVEVPVVLRVNPAYVERNNNTPLPLNYSIQALYPQPFNSQLFVQVASPYSGLLVLTLYDLQGRSVFSTIYEMKRPGVHHFSIGGQGLTSGVYLLEVRTPERLIGSRKVVLLR